MKDILPKDTLNDELQKATGVKPDWTIDKNGNDFGWLRLSGPGALIPAVQVMAACKARLGTITAYAEERGDQDKKRAIAYHFILGATVVTVSIPIYDPETMENLPVPSITPYFRNADWNEREFREMFNIEIVDHPNPKRLFLDERLDAGIMTRLIPFSTMLHGAGSKDLWEKVMAEKTGCAPASPGSESALIEPAFTPVAETSPAKDDI